MVTRVSQGKMAWAKAVECFSTLSITEILCENLTAYTEIKLYRACKAIHYGNQIRRNWWQCMEHMIHATLSKHNQSHAETTAPPHSKLSLENVAEHDNNMGNDTRKIHHMPGETVEQQWLNYIHRRPLSDHGCSNYDTRSSHTSGRACSWEELVPSL